MAPDTIYKLFQTSRSYGDESKRPSVTKIFVNESRNMSVLQKIVFSSDALDSTFVIEKYVDNIIQIRKLVYFTMGIEELPGVACEHKDEDAITISGHKTTTWEKYIYDDKIGKWKITNFRYKDEQRFGYGSWVPLNKNHEVIHN